MKVEGGGTKCNICGNVLKTKGNQTSNIIGHVLQRHPKHPDSVKLKADMEDNKAKAKLSKTLKAKKLALKSNPKVTNFFTKSRGYIDPNKAKQINEALLQMTICMDRPFIDVENHFFRKLMHTAEPNYIMPSRRTHVRRFDEGVDDVREKLKREIINDVTDAGHKTISITSDHGTSHDKKRSKKNVVTVIRTTKDFKIKSNIIKMIKCDGSQTGLRIRQDVKKVLQEGAGVQADWKVNWVTDNESKQISARNPEKHREVEGLKINNDASCVDHTIELASEDTILASPEIGKSLKKLRSFVNHQKDSSTARENLSKIIEEGGESGLTVIQGTENRWLFKQSEAERALLLQESINRFFDEHGDELPNKVCSIEEEDWDNIALYEKAMRSVVKASRIFEGGFFCTGSSVIPFLDSIFVELEALKQNLRGAKRIFVQLLLSNLRSDKRFPSGLKLCRPYNCLTLLDPRYGDLYLNEAEVGQALHDIHADNIFDQEVDLVNQQPVPEPATVAAPPPPGDIVAQRR